MEGHEGLGGSCGWGVEAGPRVGRRAGVAGGFSLLEITLVLVIIGLLLAGAAVAIGPAFLRAQEKTTKNSMKVIQTQIDSFKLNNLRLPESLDELVPGFIQEKSQLNDGWSNPFYYIAYGANLTPEYDLVSAGPDGQFDTEDDLSILDSLIEANQGGG